MDLRVYFTDFWNGFNKSDNYFTWILKQKYNVIIDDVNPQIVFTMGFSKHYPNSFTIYYSNEPFFPKFTIGVEADFFLGNFFIDKPNYKRFTSYQMYICEFLRMGLLKDTSLFSNENRVIPEKTKFCCFVSKSLTGKRGRFFQNLNSYKQVDTNVSPYNHFHLPYDSNQFNSTVPKINFIKDYKFNIAFENNWRGHHPNFPNAHVIDGELQDMGGLISEKLVEPFIAGTIPIYWGSAMVSEEFNNNTFINYYDYPHEDDLINKIIELDNNRDAYNNLFKEKICTEKNLLDIQYIVNQFDEILKYGNII